MDIVIRLCDTCSSREKCDRLEVLEELEQIAICEDSWTQNFISNPVDRATLYVQIVDKQAKEGEETDA